MDGAATTKLSSAFNRVFLHGQRFDQRSIVKSMYLWIERIHYTIHDCVVRPFPVEFGEKRIRSGGNWRAASKILPCNLYPARTGRLLPLVEDEPACNSAV